MAELSKEEFEEKWARKFADNTMQDITEAVLREFRQDIADSFAGAEPAQLRQWKIRTYWSVIFLTHAEAVAWGRPSCLSLDQLPPELLCTGSVARVDLHPDQKGQELVLVYDERTNDKEGLRAYVDSNFTRYFDLTDDGLNPQKWVKKGSLDEALASIRRYDPAYAKWAVDQTMKIDFGGTDAFFSANVAGGPFPAPTAAGEGTSYWKPAAQPTAPGGGGGGGGAPVKVDGVSIVQAPDGTLSAVSETYLFVEFDDGGGNIRQLTIQHPAQVGTFRAQSPTEGLQVYDTQINGVSQASAEFTVKLNDKVKLFANVPVGGGVWTALRIG